jgi:hypothetical protein
VLPLIEMIRVGCPLAVLRDLDRLPEAEHLLEP